MLLFTAAEVEYAAQVYLGLGRDAGATLGGMMGGVVQAYTTMGFCTFMKTVEITRVKEIGRDGVRPKTTWEVAREVYAKDGWAGMNRGVSAVAARQLTNWGGRLGIPRFTESVIRGNDPRRTLTRPERLFSSVLGGALSCWNTPFEVIRVEMQKVKDPGLSNAWGDTARRIYADRGAPRGWGEARELGERGMRLPFTTKNASCQRCFPVLRLFCDLPLPRALLPPARRHGVLPGRHPAHVLERQPHGLHGLLRGRGQGLLQRPGQVKR